MQRGAPRVWTVVPTARASEATFSRSRSSAFRRRARRALLDQPAAQVRRRHEDAHMLLWLIAAIIAIVGVVQLFQGQILLAIALFVIACLIGPGGYSVFRSRICPWKSWTT